MSPQKLAVPVPSQIPLPYPPPESSDGEDYDGDEVGSNKQHWQKRESSKHAAEEKKPSKTASAERKRKEKKEQRAKNHASESKQKRNKMHKLLQSLQLGSADEVHDEERGVSTSPYQPQRLHPAGVKGLKAKEGMKGRWPSTSDNGSEGTLTIPINALPIVVRPRAKQAKMDNGSAISKPIDNQPRVNDTTEAAMDLPAGSKKRKRKERKKMKEHKEHDQQCGDNQVTIDEQGAPKRSKASSKKEGKLAEMAEHSGRWAPYGGTKLRRRSDRKQNGSTSARPVFPFYKPHIDPELLESGLKEGSLVRGRLRVNPRDSGQSWVASETGEQDYLVLGAKDRNRALHGDTVILRLKPRQQWVLRDRVYQEWREDKLGADSAGLREECTETVDGMVTMAESSIEIRLEEEEELEDDVLPVLESEHYSTPSCSTPPADGVDAALHAGPSACLEEPLMTSNQALVVNQEKSTQPTGGSYSYSRTLLLEILAQIKPKSPLLEAALSDPNEATAKDLDQSQRSAANTATTAIRNAPRRPNFHTLRFIEGGENISDELLLPTAEAVGHLKLASNRCGGHALFIPNDPKVPVMVIEREDLPPEFSGRPQDFTSFLFVAEVHKEWREEWQLPTGKLLKKLGRSGDLETETEGLLMANRIDYREFPEHLLSEAVSIDPRSWQIDPAELEQRRDFRQHVVFTIDPPTARDLDDALHIKPIEGGDGCTYEVGVHIADVSYFLRENTQLDTWAAKRGNSVYLVDRVVPMLPRALCEHLCSLNPGEDKLTFSVVWEMDGEGRILDEWFGRSVINSSCKLSYNHAEEIILSAEGGSTSWGELPPLFNSKSADDVAQSVLGLNRLAGKLRERRLEQGALRLDQPKLKFKLAADTGLPYGVALDERGEANFLVEEFMLLANMAVARKIHSRFPDTAILRRHPPPNKKKLAELREKSTHLNYPLLGETSEELSRGLETYSSRPELRCTVVPYLHQLVMRTMRLAEYFCPGHEKGGLKKSHECADGGGDGEGDGDEHGRRFRHYALSCDLYTHFTSPIRRYPDVLVHRLLAAALGYQNVPKLTPEEVAKIAERCNEAKTSARYVSDGSAELFFLQLVKAAEKLETKGVVTSVYENSFDVLLVDYGLTRRIYLNKLPCLLGAEFHKGKVFNKLALRFSSKTSEKEGDGQACATEDVPLEFRQTIEVLSSVTVILTAKEVGSTIKQTATILPSKCEDGETAT